jgi:hypothetical protein
MELDNNNNETSGISDFSTYKISFYDYGLPFLGSYKGMCYRLARNPLQDVHSQSAEKRAEATLMATIWPQPYSFNNTEDSLKETKEFEYSTEGKAEAIAWLNEKYMAKKA